MRLLGLNCCCLHLHHVAGQDLPAHVSSGDLPSTTTTTTSRSISFFIYIFILSIFPLHPLNLTTLELSFRHLKGSWLFVRTLSSKEGGGTSRPRPKPFGGCCIFFRVFFFSCVVCICVFMCYVRVLYVCTCFLQFFFRFSFFVFL